MTAGTPSVYSVPYTPAHLGPAKRDSTMPRRVQGIVVLFVLKLFVNLNSTQGTVEVATNDDFDGRDPRLHYAGYPQNKFAYLQVRAHGHNTGSAGHWYVVIWDHPTYVSARTAGTVNGFSYAPGDVLVYYECSDTWELFFDASDVGLSLNTNGFAH